MTVLYYITQVPGGYKLYRFERCVGSTVVANAYVWETVRSYAPKGAIVLDMRMKPASQIHSLLVGYIQQLAKEAKQAKTNPGRARRRRNPDDEDEWGPEIHGPAEDPVERQKRLDRLYPERAAARRDAERRKSVGQVTNEALSRYGEMRRRETSASLKQILRDAVEYAVDRTFGRHPPEGFQAKVHAEATRLLGLAGVRFNPRRRR